MLMRNIRCWLVFLAALVLTFSVANAPFCAFAVDEADARSAIAAAEERIVVCYRAVADADRAGANVSELLVKLEFAGALLAEAYNTYNTNRTDNYDKPYLLAINCSEGVSGIADEALGLKLEAENAYSGRLFMTAAVSSVALCVLFVLGLFGWRFLKKKYVERVLGMKPEVREG